MLKKIILNIFMLMLLCTVSIFARALSHSEIANMVSEIKKERQGITLTKLESTENPFILKVAEAKESISVKEELSIFSKIEVVYTLKAILNKAAFINKKWYKLGDSIGIYTIGYISATSVVLKNANDSKTLSLEKKKKNFIKSNRGYR